MEGWKEGEGEEGGKEEGKRMRNKGRSGGKGRKMRTGERGKWKGGFICRLAGFSLIGLFR